MSANTAVSSKREATGSATQRSARAQSAPPLTGLEESGILSNASRKRAFDQFTQSDEDSYTKRLKLSNVSGINNDVLTEKGQRLITHYFVRYLTKHQKEDAAKLRYDAKRFPATSQQGMRNPAVLCYRLSLIQSLLHLPVFSNWVLDNLMPSNCVSDHAEDCLACCLYQLVREYWAGTNVNKTMSRLDTTLRKLGWASDTSSGHADPDEQLLIMFQILRTEIPTSIFSLLDTMAFMKYTSVVACRACGHKSTSPNQSSHNLSLPMSSSDKSPSLTRYIGEFASDIVSGYKCPGCHKAVDARKYIELTHFPDILAIQLKRVDPFGEKNNSKVSIPPSLPLSKFLTRVNSRAELAAAYELAAVIKHAGTGDFGHYTCSAKGPDGQWVLFDDSTVSRTNIREASKNDGRFTPYMLYYQKKRA